MKRNLMKFILYLRAIHELSLDDLFNILLATLGDEEQFSGTSLVTVKSATTYG